MMEIERIKRIAVIGAGDMGHGIAEVALLGGYEVSLYDINDGAVARGANRIVESLAKHAEKGKAPLDAMTKLGGQMLRQSTDLEETAKDADVVIEVAPEDLSIKKDLFTKLDQYAPAHALLASNTSTMSITEMAAMTGRPGQVLGMHFFNPAVLMKLVEVVKGEKTTDETIRLGVGLAERFGKVPVVVRRDTPGFIMNRVNQAPGVLIGEILERGEIEPEALDAFTRRVGWPMGPCELTDYVGVDIAVNASKYFAQKLGADYGPAAHQVKMVGEGRLGKKTGRGYFDWPHARPTAIHYRQIHIVR